VRDRPARSWRDPALSIAERVGEDLRPVPTLPVLLTRIAPDEDRRPGRTVREHLGFAVRPTSSLRECTGAGLPPRESASCRLPAGDERGLSPDLTPPGRFARGWRP
jgi:hypothetical protein